MELGENIGKIRIVDRLGKGGMGEVYMGYDEKLERHVAVKVIKGGKRMDPEAKERFMREAKLLSQLEHPNICRIYDFVECAGHDFIVLELIKGKDLKDVAKGMPWKTKLRIAEQIAEVLAVAHERRIVHRDLKPDNVMITPEGQVKVLDFGLALTVEEKNPVLRAADSRGESIPVDFGDRVVRFPAPQELKGGGFRTAHGIALGTPMYMSPEQARSEPATAASDMYSFGLLLQWLFTEEQPYPSGLTGMGLHIRAMQGDTEPVKGIDTSVTLLINHLKSIAPENRPIAKDTRDRLREISLKPIRRLKAIALAAFVIVLVTGTLFSTVGFVKARRSEKRALEGEANAKQTLELMREFLSSVDPAEKGKDLKVYDLLDAFKPRLNELEDKPLIQASLYEAYATTYRGLGLWEESRACALRSLALRETELGSDDPETLAVQHCLASVLWSLGRYSEAESQWKAVLDQNQRVLGSDHPMTLESIGELSRTLRALARYEEAEKLARDAVSRMRRVLGPEHRSTLEFMRVLGNTLWDMGRFGDAEEIQREAWEIRKRVLGDDHPETLMSCFYVALAMREQDLFRETEILLRDLNERLFRVLGSQHMVPPFSLCNLGFCLSNLDEHDEAEALCREGKKMLEGILGEKHPTTAAATWYLAETLSRRGKHDEAKAFFHSALETYGAALGEAHPYFLLATTGFARNLYHQGDKDDAESLLKENISKQKRILGDRHPWTRKSVDLLEEILKTAKVSAEKSEI